jgi:RNA polymerase sigma factor (sigma-70 family)
MKRDPDESIRTRKSLLKRLKNWDDQESWKDFFDTYWKLIHGVAVKSGLTNAEAQDVVQETIFAVAKKMGGFDYDPEVGSFKAWLLTLTRWRITDAWRKKQYEQAGRRKPREEPLHTSILDRQAAPSDSELEKIWQAEWDRNVLEVALARVRAQVKPKPYQLFYLHFIRNWDAKRVAQKLGAKLTEVYYAKYKIRPLLKREIQAVEETMT